MKKRLILDLLLLFVCLNSNAQDTSLYQGPSDIYNRSGEVLKKITLWKIDSVRVTYIYKENLSEVLTADVLRIVTNYYELSFDEQSHVIRKEYDLIIQRPGDTVKGFIVTVLNDRYLEYTPVNGKRNKETIYESFITKQTGKPSNAIQKHADTVTLKTVDAKKMVYPSAKNNSKNKDIIITKSGDTLLCHILKVNNVKIEYSILRFGHDQRADIDKKNVQYYHDAKDAKAGWKVPVTIVVVSAVIFATLVFIVNIASY